MDRDRYRSRDRRRSRSRDRRRRSRSRDRRSSRDIDRRRDRSRDRERTKRYRSRSPIQRNSPSLPPPAAAPEPEQSKEMQEQESAMEEKIRLRKEKLEQWKKERALKEKPAEKPKPVEQPKPVLGKPAKKSLFKSIAVPAAAKQPEMAPKRVVLEDDDSDEEAKPSRDFDALDKSVMKSINEEPADEEDPLETFMTQVDSEVKLIVEEDERKREEEKDQMEVDNIEELLKDAENPDDDEDGSVRPLQPQMDEYDEVYSQITRKRNHLLETDHSKIDYEPFRKNFYVEPPDLAALTPAQVNQMRLDLDGIKVRGSHCPKPIQRWSQFGMPPGVHEVIRKVLKFERPSPIQAQAIPAIMSGRDVIGIARTGSGKVKVLTQTIAFLLPMFRHIKDQRPVKLNEGPIGLIMAPTRELATQIYRDCKYFTKHLNIRVVCCYGGAPLSEQIADLKRGAEIVICTPGRMLDLMCANGGRVTNLRRVTYLVIDEADRMFDLGFEPQVMKLVYNIRRDRQSLLFSATFPQKMEALAKKILYKPLEIVVGARSVVGKDVTQIVEVHHDEDSKFLRLLDVLGRTAAENSDLKTLIFVDRQDSADKLLSDLMRRGYTCFSIHGGKDQSDRDQIIQDFKVGNINILIATSIAARGLDVKDLRNVVNFDCPNHLEDYVHRCGRTGRAGNKGTAYTFITPDQERYSGEIVRALKKSGANIPYDLSEMYENYEAKERAGQIASTGAGYGGKGLDQMEFQREIKKIIESKTHGAEDDEIEEDGPPPDPEGYDTSGKAVVLRKPLKMTMREKALALIHDKYMPEGVQAGRNTTNATFFAEIEINDYPQLARFKVTSKEHVHKMCQVSGASITVRGIYVTPGQKPPFGERKLHLYVQADNQYSVNRAKQEIRDCLNEVQVMKLEHALGQFF